MATMQQFCGKRLVRVDSSAANCWVLHFDDGSYAVVDTEAKGYGIYGPVLVEHESKVVNPRIADGT
jgi:hypothetical protein